MSESDLPKANQRETVTEDTQTKQDGSNAQPALRTEIHIPPAEVKSGKADQDKGHRLERKRFFVEILTLIAIGIYAWITYGMWEEMHSTGKQTDKLIAIANKQSENAVKLADAAKSHAIAAQKTAEIAERTLQESARAFQHDQRAWVGVRSKKMITLAANSPATAEIALANAGKTIARNVRARVTIRSDFEPFDLKRFLKERPPPKKEPTSSRFIMLPNDEFQLPAHHSSVLSEERLLLIKANIVRVYLFGEITYDDVFGKSHITEFCGIYQPRSNDFALCREYNNAN